MNKGTAWRNFWLARTRLAAGKRGWEEATTAGLGDHELAHINRRNELDPDLVLWKLARSSITTTRRP